MSTTVPITKGSSKDGKTDAGEDWLELASWPAYGFEMGVHNELIGHISKLQKESTVVDHR